MKLRAKFNFSSLKFILANEKSVSISYPANIRHQFIKIIAEIQVN